MFVRLLEGNRGKNLYFNYLKILINALIKPLFDSGPVLALKGTKFRVSNKVKKKFAVITGCSSGIGLELTYQLLAMSFRVHGLSRTKPDIDDPNFDWSSVDLSSFQSLSHFLSTKPFSFDGSDEVWLINCAGMLGPIGSHYSSTHLELIEKTHTLNYTCCVGLSLYACESVSSETRLNIIQISSELLGRLMPVGSLTVAQRQL